MSFRRGDIPRQNHLPVLSLLGMLLAALLGSVVASPVRAQSTLPLTMAEAEDLAQIEEPGRIALEAQAAALNERSVVAGELPDPTLRIGLDNFPLETGDFSAEGMTKLMVGYRQTFPGGETRSLSLEKYALLADSMTENAATRSRNVRTSTQNAWLELYFLENAEALIRESRPLFSDLVDITRSLYSVGRTKQQDVFHADLGLSRLDDRLIDIDLRRARARAELAEWIGTDAERPIATNFPRWDTVPPLADLQQGLTSHPAVLAAEAHIGASEADVRIADERSKADWALDVAYGYREGNLPSGESRSDLITVGVTFALPFFSEKSVDSTLTVALHERTAARSSKVRLERELRRQLDAEYAEWQELSRRIALFDAEILHQAQNQADAALLAYQSDAGDFADVMRANITFLNARIEHLRLIVDRAQSYAMLINLGGLNQ